MSGVKILSSFNKPQISMKQRSVPCHLPILIVSLATFIWLWSGEVSTNSAQKPSQSSGKQGKKSPVFRNTARGIEYVGSQVCAKCHGKIYQQYMQTGMGRDMSAVNSQSHLEKAPSLVTLVNPALKRYFQVFREGNELYQSEYELDAEGNEVFRHTQKLAYAIGSGANGFSYVVRRGDHLFQAPLSYYTRAQAWGFSPGYETADHGFGRPIQAGCIQCHSGRPPPSRKETACTSTHLSTKCQSDVRTVMGRERCTCRSAGKGCGSLPRVTPRLSIPVVCRRGWPTTSA